MAEGGQVVRLTYLLRLNPPDGRSSHIEWQPEGHRRYDCKVPELYAIAGNTGLADRAAISARQVGLVVKAKHIDRKAGRVGAQANAIKLSRRPIGVGDGAGAVANVRVGHNLAVRVRAIGEPQPATGKFRKDVCVQPPQVSLLGLGLTGEVRLDLLRYIHLAPYASNERPMPGRWTPPGHRRCPRGWPSAANRTTIRSCRAQ